MKRKPALALSLATTTLVATLAATLAACAPPVSRQRLEIRVDADGTCHLQAQVAACKDVGAVAAARYTPGGVSAVLLIDPKAPHDKVLALRSSLQSAQVTHVQYGDPSTFKFDRSEPGADG